MLLFTAVCRHWDEALTSHRITHVRLVLLIEDFDDPFPSILVHLETISAQLRLYRVCQLRLRSQIGIEISTSKLCEH